MSGSFLNTSDPAIQAALSALLGALVGNISSNAPLVASFTPVIPYRDYARANDVQVQWDDTAETLTLQGGANWGDFNFISGAPVVVSKAIQGKGQYNVVDITNNVMTVQEGLDNDLLQVITLYQPVSAIKWAQVTAVRANPAVRALRSRTSQRPTYGAVV
jgi:hypothetical protein